MALAKCRDEALCGDNAASLHVVERIDGVGDVEPSRGRHAFEHIAALAADRSCHWGANADLGQRVRVEIGASAVEFFAMPSARQWAGGQLCGRWPPSE